VGRRVSGGGPPAGHVRLQKGTHFGRFSAKAARVKSAKAQVGGTERRRRRGGSSIAPARGAAREKLPNAGGLNTRDPLSPLSLEANVEKKFHLLGTAALVKCCAVKKGLALTHSTKKSPRYRGKGRHSSGAERAREETLRRGDTGEEFSQRETKSFQKERASTPASRGTP